MEKFTNEELLETLPVELRETKELTTKQKVVLGQLMIYNGLDKKDDEGYFFRSNLELASDCDIQEKTVIAAIRRLVYLELIKTKRGSRRTGASYYKVLEDNIKDYCKTHTGDYSNDMVGMADRIKELEITVKNLNRNYSNNYSTDTEIDIEIDKDLELVIYNILKNTSKKNLLDILNNILEDSLRKEELVKAGTGNEIPVSHPVLTESEASAPSEDVSQASPVTDSTQVGDTNNSTKDESIPVEQQTIPTDEEQYQQWLQVQTPYLKGLEDVKTLEQFEIIKTMLKQVGGEYLDNHEYISPAVVERMNKTVGTALNTKKKGLLPVEMELSDYLKLHN